MLYLWLLKLPPLLAKILTLQGSAKAWNTEQREAAKLSVQQAVARWKLLEAQQPKQHR